MAVTNAPCGACGRKRGHAAGCVNANPCPECGYTTGHAGNCPHGYNNQREVADIEERRKVRSERTLVDGEEAVVLNGKSGAPLEEQELIQVTVEELIDTLTTHMTIRSRYQTHREFWAKKVKGADDAIDKIVHALADRGQAKENILQKLDAEAPER